MLEYRVATPPDAPQLADLINQAFRSEQAGQLWRFDEQEKRVEIVSAPLISSLINNTAHVMLVGTSGADHETALSCCSLRKPSESPEAYMTPGAAWLGLLAVSTACQGSGHGRDILEYAESFVTDVWHLQRLELDTVNTRVELNAWYKRCGFVEFGERRSFQYGRSGHQSFVDGLEVIVLGKDLAHATPRYNTSQRQD